MQPFLSRTLITLLMGFLLILPSGVLAVDAPRKHHPWATFSPGAWRQDRIIVQVFDKDGNVVDWGVTEKKTTLEEVNESGVTLRVEESVWVAGKVLDRQPKTIKQGIYGESEGQKATIKDLDPKTLNIEGRKIPCVVREVRIADPSTKGFQISRLYVNNDVAPFVLKRKTTITAPDEKTVLSETNIVVDSLKVLSLASDQLFSASHFRTSNQHAKGTTMSLGYTSTEVPGGIVHECTKKVDKEGHLVERSVLELIDCDAEPAADRPRRRHLPRRLRNWRLRAEQEKPAEE